MIYLLCQNPHLSGHLSHIFLVNKSIPWEKVERERGWEMEREKEKEKG